SNQETNKQSRNERTPTLHISRETDGKMSWKMRWEIGWKITPIGQVSSSHYFTDTQEVMRWLEDMVDIFIYSILFIAL
uniref:hypothetical protein n=2 Tax=Leyella stercorea TaxID=363265 RepID=UPI002671F6AE